MPPQGAVGEPEPRPRDPPNFAFGCGDPAAELFLPPINCICLGLIIHLPALGCGFCYRGRGLFSWGEAL